LKFSHYFPVRVSGILSVYAYECVCVWVCVFVIFVRSLLHFIHLTGFS